MANVRIVYKQNAPIQFPDHCVVCGEKNPDTYLKIPSAIEDPVDVIRAIFALRSTQYQAPVHKSCKSKGKFRNHAAIWAIGINTIIMMMVLFNMSFSSGALKPLLIFFAGLTPCIFLYFKYPPSISQLGEIITIPNRKFAEAFYQSNKNYIVETFPKLEY